MKSETQSFPPAEASTLRRLELQADPLADASDSLLRREPFLRGEPHHACHGGLRTRGRFKNDDTQLPLVSIVTIVYNGAQYIEHTIRSVLELRDEHVEYIIVDGGSTDGTLDILRRYDDYLDYWVSERDAGISDAFNKGLSLTRGSWIGLINADDWYEPQALERVRAAMPRGDIIGGAMRCHFRRHVMVRQSQSELLRLGMFMNHPTCFVRTSVYARVGGFDATYRLAMDYDLLLRAREAGAVFVDLPEVQANMRMIGISVTQNSAGHREVFRIKRKFYRIRPIDYIFYVKVKMVIYLKKQWANLF